MREHSLNIGEVKTFDHPVILTCYGLGSCIGLFVQDRAKGISGGAHILLPKDSNMHCEDGKYYHASQAVDQLLDQFKNQGSDLKVLRAKIVGGANMLNTTINIGASNVAEIKDQLVNKRIYIAAADVGGTSSRTAKFNATSGRLEVRSAENHEIKIL